MTSGRPGRRTWIQKNDKNMRLKGAKTDMMGSLTPRGVSNRLANRRGRECGSGYYRREGEIKVDASYFLSFVLLIDSLNQKNTQIAIGQEKAAAGATMDC